MVFGTGYASPLDKEHIINTMFKVARYGKKVIFFKDNPIAEIALKAAQDWKRLNDFSVELIVIDERNIKQRQQIPQLYDCIIYFISEETDKNPEFQEQQKILAEEGVRVEKYILGTWDKMEK